MARKDYIEKINQNLEHLTKDELKDVNILTTAQYGVRLKVAEKEYIEKEIANLKSQLQQQALPVVPDFIGKLINTFGSPEDGKYINYAASYPVHKKELDWIDNHQKTWLTALLIGFTVEKTQLFYLREKNTNYYLNKSKNNGLELVPNPYFDEDNQFTKQEIDSMQTGSYEQIPVPVEDGE
ncbi:DUF1642 domain-containing protein [Lactococcus lactis]|uniref:DUF1642 domain-containing protein n=1 Tax=Lactococcus lactis TaxID=1358 RepID=UPI00223B0D79|nr:DUF1642 domain-containing protein [Lactococcus lactis]MCT1228238.1 DUF1642 domain-containing protein [Lactococcus lactis]